MNRRTAIISAICATGMITFLAGFIMAYGGDTGEVLKITPAQFDFGTVDEGNAATATATVENIGGTRVEITNVRTS
jgi:hypothetical protein